MYEALKLRIREDHDKLDRVFLSLRQTFNSMDSADDKSDAEHLEDAREDLRFALEEMLEHFGIEEEAIFAQIAEALPDMQPRLAQLARAHEGMCRTAGRLRMMVAAADRNVKQLDIASAQELLDDLTRLLHHHNAQEIELFIEAADRLDDAGRAQLLSDIESL